MSATEIYFNSCFDIVEGTLVFFHVDADGPERVVRDLDGYAYDREGAVLSTGVVVSLKGFGWWARYDVLCDGGIVRCLNAFDIEGVVRN